MLACGPACDCAYVRPSGHSQKLPQSLFGKQADALEKDGDSEDTCELTGIAFARFELELDIHIGAILFAPSLV